MTCGIWLKSPFVCRLVGTVFTIDVGRHRPQIVVAGEIEERLVAAVVDFGNPDRAADSAAGGVQAILRAEARRVIAVLVDAPAGGFPDVAPHAVRPCAVEVVGAGPGGEDLDSAADASVLRGIGADQQFDLAECLGGRRIENRAARFRDDVARAVDQLLARAARRAGDAESRRRSSRSPCIPETPRDSAARPTTSAASGTSSASAPARARWSPSRAATGWP